MSPCRVAQYYCQYYPPSTAPRPSRTRPRTSASASCRCEHARKMAGFGRVWGGHTGSRVGGRAARAWVPSTSWGSIHTNHHRRWNNNGLMCPTRVRLTAGGGGNTYNILAPKRKPTEYSRVLGTALSSTPLPSCRTASRTWHRLAPRSGVARLGS